MSRIIVDVIIIASTAITGHSLSLKRLFCIVAVLVLCACSAWAGGGLGLTGKEEKGTTLESVLDLESISPSDEGVVQIELPGVGARDFMTRFVGDTLFLPYMSFCDFLRIPNNVSPDYLELGGQFPVGQPFEISRLSSTAHAGKTDVFLPPTAIRVARGEVYIEQSFLLKLFGLAASYDTNDLKLRIAPDPKIPAIQNVKNNEKYANLAFEDEPGMTMPDAEAEHHLMGNPVIDWTFSNQSTLNTNATNGSLRIGTEFLYGTLEVNTSAGVVNMKSNSFKGQLNNWNWRYFMPQSSALREIGIGALPVGDKQYYAAEISNVPLTPRTGFAMHDLRGQTQAGWTVEMYDGPRLVDVTTADSAGRYQFRVPVGYGTVDRFLRYIGPYGEVITEQRRIQLNTQMVPAGDFEYTARTGFQNMDFRSPMAAEVHTQYGVSDWLSMGVEGVAAATSFRSMSRDSVQASLFANLWLGDAHSVTARYNVQGKFFGGEYYTMMTSGVAIRAVADSISTTLSQYVLQANASMPIDEYTPSFLARVSKSTAGYLAEFDPALSASFLGMNMIGSVRMQLPLIKTHGSIVDPMHDRPFSAYMNLRLMRPIGAGWVLSSELDFNQLTHKMETVQTGIYMRLFNSLGVNLGMVFHDVDFGHLSMKDLRASTFQVQFDIDLHQAKVSVSGDRQSSSVSGALTAQGSAMISPVGIVTTPTFGLGQSAILVKPFHDDNQNGVHDPGEEFLDPMVATLSQGRTQFTSTDGSFTSLPANTQWVLEVDRWTFAEDGLFPSRTRYSIFTTPSSMQVIEVACVEGFDVMGNCKVEEVITASGKKQDFSGLLNGLRVSLVSSTTGAVFDGEVFSDGSIFIPGVCSGEYRFSFDQNQLASRRLSVVSLTDVVTLNSENHRIPAIMLQRTPR